MWYMTPGVGWPLVWRGVAGCASGIRDVARLSGAPDDGHNSARNMSSKL
jgi:hypothetical protein